MPTCFAGGDRFVQPVERVVIGQRDDVKSGVARLVHQRGRLIRPVGDRGMGVQVDAHA